MTAYDLPSFAQKKPKIERRTIKNPLMKALNDKLPLSDEEIEAFERM